MSSRAIAGVVLLCLCATASADRPAAPEPIPREAVEQAPATPPDPSLGVVYVCPMDPDIRAYAAGVCRRCGMKLVAGVPDPAAFHLDVRVVPAAPKPGKPSVLQFLVHDPWKDRPVGTFNVVHERLFHAFVVSEDLQFFAHGHPALIADGVFQYPIVFPGAGMFRVLADFYPQSATPQLTATTVIVPGTAPDPARVERDYSPKRGANMEVSLATIPEMPVAGNRTQLRVTLDAQSGLQKYLGAWGHLLAVSDDLIDMMHEHPYRAEGGSQIEFALVFPRARPHRIWMQFQRDGVVNTVHFDVPVSTEARPSAP
jgi:hypothetical protein